MKDARLIPEMAVGKRAKKLSLKPGLARTPRRKKGRMQSRRRRGFSLVELMVVIALILVVSGFSVMAIQPSMKEGNVTNGYNQTLTALRQARDTAVAQRQIYFVTLNDAVFPNQITITQGSTGTVTASYFLPSDVIFVAWPGLPNSPLGFPRTPDGFGIGNVDIDFDQGIAGG